MGEHGKRALLLAGLGSMGLAAAAMQAAVDAGHLVVAHEDLPPPPARRITRFDEAPPIVYAGDRRPRRAAMSPAQRMMQRSQERARRAR